MPRRSNGPLKGARFCINTNPLQPEVHDLENETHSCCIDEIVSMGNAEPCDNVAHPDGCPQGVETCYVDPTLTDYEEACRQCCNSRYHQPLGLYACWDETYNICRHPYDCGTPYP